MKCGVVNCITGKHMSFAAPGKKKHLVNTLVYIFFDPAMLESAAFYRHVVEVSFVFERIFHHFFELVYRSSRRMNASQ